MAVEVVIVQPTEFRDGEFPQSSTVVNAMMQEIQALRARLLEMESRQREIQTRQGEIQSRQREMVTRQASNLAILNSMFKLLRNLSAKQLPCPMYFQPNDTFPQVLLLFQPIKPKLAPG